jgi:hypothetical protein
LEYLLFVRLFFRATFVTRGLVSQLVLNLPLLDIPVLLLVLLRRAGMMQASSSSSAWYDEKPTGRSISATSGSARRKEDGMGQFFQLTTHLYCAIFIPN